MDGQVKKCDVVICDDHKGFRSVLSIALSLDPDLEVVGEAGNGQEAVRIVSELRPAIVILDIAMPVMDGLEALPLILETAPLTQVVILTGFASRDLRRRALEGGACMFLEKGMDVPALVDQIKGLCLRGAAPN